VEDKSNGLPLSFYVVAVSSFLFSLTRNVTQPVFTLYVLDLGADLLQVGLVVSVQSFLMIVSRIPLTMVAERIGYRRMFLIAFLVQMTSPIMYAFIPGPMWLYVIPFYEIIASGSNMAPPHRQGDAIGRYMTFMTMGMFVGPLITGVLLTYFSYSQLYLTASLFPFIGFLLFLRYIPKEGVFERAEVEAGDEGEIGVLDSLKVILRDRNVLILSLIRTTYSMANTIFTTLFVLYAVSIGFTESQAALLYSMVGFANAFSKLPAGRIADRLGSKKVLMATFTTLILVYLTMSYSRGLAPILISLILFGVCWGTRAVTEWALLAVTVPPKTKAMAMSYLSSIWGVGSMMGGFLVGVLGDSLPFSTMFILLALINVPAVPAIYLMKGRANGKDSGSH
jgi:MFS family permease